MKHNPKIRIDFEKENSTWEFKLKSSESYAITLSHHPKFLLIKRVNLQDIE